MDEQNIDSAPPQKKPKKTSIILLSSLCIILYAINSFLSFLTIDISNIKGSAAIQQAALFGAISAQLTINLVVPLFLVGLFQLHKAFRNFRSIVKIFLWASLVLLFLNFVTIFQKGIG